MPNISRSVEVRGPGASNLTVRRSGDFAPPFYRIFTVTSGTTVSISGLTVANGGFLQVMEGGGILNQGTLTIENAVISGNSAEHAGGISNHGTLTVINSTLSNNGTSAVGGQGGGILNSGMLTLIKCVIVHNGSTNGGGVNNSGGTATITDCTFTDNGADLGGGLSNGGTATVTNSTLSENIGGDAGGGIFNHKNLTLSNVTIYGNKVWNGSGGGISFFPLGIATISISNSTISANVAGTMSSGAIGGGIVTGGGAVSIKDSIIAGNSASGSKPDVSGGLTSIGHNLIGNSTGGSGYADTDILDVDPVLDVLQDNGGPTKTVALLPGSPAIDAGDNTDAPDFDQRGDGFPRIVNDIIDIGAFEVQAQKHAVPVQFTAIGHATDRSPSVEAATAQPLRRVSDPHLQVLMPSPRPAPSEPEAVDLFFAARASRKPSDLGPLMYESF